MKQPGCLLISLAILVLPGCRVQRGSHQATASSGETTAVWKWADSLRLQQQLRHTATGRVEWREVTLSPPDSAGRQHAVKWATATARVETETAATASRQSAGSATATTASRHQSTGQQQSSTKRTLLHAPVYWLLGALAVSGFLCILLRRKIRAALRRDSTG